MAEDAKRTSKHTRLAIKNACEICCKKKVPFLMVYEKDEKGSHLLTNIGLNRLKNFREVISKHITEIETKAKLQEGDEQA